MKKYIILLFIGAFGLFAFKAEDYFEISKNLDIFAEVYKEANTTYVDDVKPKMAAFALSKALIKRNGVLRGAKASVFNLEISKAGGNWLSSFIIKGCNKNQINKAPDDQSKSWAILLNQLYKFHASVIPKLQKFQDQETHNIMYKKN